MQQHFYIELKNENFPSAEIAINDETNRARNKIFCLGGLLMDIKTFKKNKEQILNEFDTKHLLEYCPDADKGLPGGVNHLSKHGQN